MAEKISLSPDGHWVAVGTRNHIGVRVLDTVSGVLQWKADLRYGTRPVFSSDNQWLVVGTDSGCYVYAAATGERRWHRAPNKGDEPSFWEVAISPDNSMVAWTPKSSLLQLLDARTGEEILTLDYPSRRYITHLAFSPDGEWLAEASNKHAIHLWNLRRMRNQLKAMRLDW
jgi:WD40 repeat protein